MKLIVGAAVLDAMDRGELRLSNEILVKPHDISPGPDEFANLVMKHGAYTATVEELLRRSIAESDSTSVDVLIDYIGGIRAVQNFLERKTISGIRVDRTERELQTESVGLLWKPEYSDLKKFNSAIHSIPIDRRNEAWRAHLGDPRDRATPAGMTDFLLRLIEGRLLSASSTDKLLSIMSETSTGKDRLRARLPANWKIAHKTGTGRTWQSVTETTNDVGILMAPDGTCFAVAVFLAGSKAPSADQATVIASVGDLLFRYFGSTSDIR
jgi:beta-lactamase class A